jgi:pyruvate ferredoxin oxidoreductase alpha subunit
MTANLGINGDSAVALAWKQVDPDVCAAYPITPQTIIVEKFSDYVADGEVETEFVCTESEHSAMTMCIASASAGARTVTATASAGLAFMWETLGIASGLRVPVTMVVANRALSGPLNIHCDHSDVMAARDLGWVQMFAENVQEAYDNAIMAMRIAEHPDVQLPVMTNLDGFILTHAIERMTPLDTHTVKDFVGEYKPLYPLLDVENPVTHGVMDLQDSYFEHRYQVDMAMKQSIQVIVAATMT